MKSTQKTYRETPPSDERNWPIRRIKDVSRINPATRIPRNQLVDFFPMEAIGVNGGLSRGQIKDSGQANGYSQFKNNDVLFAKVTPCFENGKSAIGYALATGVALATTEVTVLRPSKNITPAFLHYRIKGLDFAIGGKNEMKGSGGLKRVPEKYVADFRFGLPCRDEQNRIAAWLALQTNRIDKRRELFSKKRELLHDLKKSVIEETTFRGVAASVEMRDSGIDWLGQVPAHWTTMRLGSLFREAADPGIDGLPMLSVSLHTGITDQELDDQEMERKVSRSEDRTLYKRVKPGDLVYNQMRAWQGAFGAAKIEGLVSPAYVVARPGRAVVPRFVEFLLRAPAAMDEIRRRSRGITDFRLRLYWDEFKNIRIALPPKSEQEKIAAFLDRKLSQIDRQIALIDQLDDLLQQQRKAIIHEAVTGKIDLSGEPVAQSHAMLEES